MASNASIMLPAAAANAGNNSYARRAAKTYEGMSGFYKGLFIFFIIIIVGLLIYWGVTSRSGALFSTRVNPVIISDPINAFDNGLSNRGINLPQSTDGMEFTYSFWLYVQDWTYNYGNNKYIFVKGNVDSGPSGWAPSLYLGSTLNTLETSIAVYSPSSSSDAKTFNSCIVKDIPLQKWVYVAYILNNRNIDIYIDGKLEKSCLLDGVPSLNNKPLYVTPKGPNTPGNNNNESGFYGQLSSFQYYSRALGPSEVSDIYVNGPYAAL